MNLSEIGRDCHRDPRQGCELTGMQVGRYLRIRLLGEGGFGETWLVEREGIPGERLVLKRLNHGWKGNTKAEELFRREAEVLGRLRHGALPRLVEAFVDDEGMALVQSFVEGTDVERLLQQGRCFEEDEVAGIVARVLEVLDYLHNVQPPVIHRDIKPGNLILGEDGRLTLIDFGAVKEIAASPRGGNTIIQSEGYSPPEQLQGHVSPANDLYALGATALHLLTGKSPAELYDARTGRLKAHLDCSGGFAEVLYRLTDPVPANRYACARVALEELRRLQPSSRRTPLPPLHEDGRALLMPGNLKSCEDVPAAIRRTVRALEEALDGSCTVWYEPLFDPKGEKPHLAVLLPHYGIAVLEVLDVTKKKLLGILPFGLRIQVVGKEAEVPSPLERADRLAAALGRRKPGVPVIPLAVLPGLERLQSEELKKLMDLERCLFREDLEDMLPALLKAMGHPPFLPADAETEQRLRGLMQPAAVLPTRGLFSPEEGEADVVAVMDRKQESLARSLGPGHRVLRGVAGSGKTMVLVCRARLLSELFPRQELLVACYTRSLAGQLRDLLSPCRNVTVDNLDHLMAEAIKGARLRHPGYGGDDSGDRVAEVALAALAQGAGRRFDAVLLDEAQDFGTAALQFAVRLLKPGHDELLVVADAAQNIFRRQFTWRQAGIQAQGRTQILKVNYRNTREILKFAFDYLVEGGGLQVGEPGHFEDENTVIPPEAACRSGPEPLMIERANLRDRVEAAAERVATWVRQGAGPRSIGVLYPSSRQPGVEELERRLRQLQVPVFWLTDPSNKARRDGFSSIRDPVVLTTVHSSKGLEFDRVALCGLAHPDLDPAANRKLAYVGMTRARDELVVIS